MKAYGIKIIDVDGTAEKPPYVKREVSTFQEWNARAIEAERTGLCMECGTKLSGLEEWTCRECIEKEG